MGFTKAGQLQFLVFLLDFFWDCFRGWASNEMKSRTKTKILLVSFEIFLFFGLLGFALSFKGTSFFYPIIAIGTLIFAFGLVVTWRTRGALEAIKRKEIELEKFATRDRATGLFNGVSFEILLRQEIARAAREKYPITMLLIRIPTVKDVEKEHGTVAANRLLYQMAEIFKKFCRGYDSIFHYDRQSFIVVFPETPPNFINMLVARFREHIGKKRFLIRPREEKTPPRIEIGAACFPLNGDNPKDLCAFATQTLAQNFDAGVIFPQKNSKKENEDIVSRTTVPLGLQNQFLKKEDGRTEDEDLPDIVFALSQEKEDPSINSLRSDSVEPRQVSMIAKGHDDVVLVDFDRERKLS